MELADGTAGGAAHRDNGGVLHPPLRVLQGLPQGAGVRELVHPCELHLSEGAQLACNAGEICR